MNKPKWTWNWHYLWQAPFYLFGWGETIYIFLDAIKQVVGVEKVFLSIGSLVPSILLLIWLVQRKFVPNFHKRMLYFGYIMTVLVVGGLLWTVLSIS